MKKKSLVYFQSGGPTTVINCSFYGVIAEALKHDEISGLYGSLHGVEGLIDDNLVDLRKEDLEDIELLKQTPGAALGSSRKKLPPVTDPLFKKILSTIKKHDIGYILVNGGNDSMDTCNVLDKFFKKEKMDIQVIGIPKTIDNDLMVTDHCLGYPSAARHVINSLKMVTEDAKAYSKGKVILVEIMGRNAGWLTASVDLLPDDERPDLIYLPEMDFDMKRFLKEVNDIYQKKGYCVVACSEGLKIPHKNNGVVDSFGHASLEGVCLTLSDEIKDKLDIGTRVMDLSLAQRADPILASETDKEEAILCGKESVLALLRGESGKMVCIKRKDSDAYLIETFLNGLEDIANHERHFPKEWIIDERRLSDDFRRYLTPLVDRECHVEYQNGIFLTAKLRFIKA